MKTFAVAAVLLLAGCASHAPTQTGFLGDYSSLKPTPAHADTPAYRKLGSLKAYTAFYVDDVAYRPTEKAALTVEEAGELSAEYRHRLETAFAERYRRATGPGPGVMRIRAAVTNATAANPLANAVTMALVFVPMTAGGASTEAEVLDSVTGERLAAYQGFNNGGRSFLGGPIGFLTVHGQARSALCVQAEELRDLLKDEG